MFKVQYANASKLKVVIQALSKISDELYLQVGLDSLQLKALSPDKTMMASMVLPGTAFDEYNVEEEAVVLLPATELKKVTKRATRNDVAQLSMSRGSSELGVLLRDKKTGLEREFTVPIIPRPPEPLPELNIDLGVTFTMLSQDLKQIVGDLKLIGEEAVFIYEVGKIVVKSVEQRKEYTCELREGNPLTLLTSTVERAQATYSIDMLVSATRVASASKQAMISFDSGKPLKFEYELSGGGRLVYWIVPRM